MPSTMYEFLEGLRYTYYCTDENGCDSTYWNSLDTSDAPLTINPYTIDDSTLSIDLYFGNTIYLSHFSKNIGLRIPSKLNNSLMIKCISNLGLPNGKNMGNLYILLNLVFPEDISDDIIERYFPKITKYENLDFNKKIEIYRL